MSSLEGGPVDYDVIVNAILNEDFHQQRGWVASSRRGEPVEIDDQPVGLQEYHLSEHTKKMNTIEFFEFSNEWIEKHPALHHFLKEELSDWWGDQLHDDPDIFRCWLDGNKILVHPDSYLGTLVEELLKTYRLRITETWTCEECGKEISEKHPLGHADSIHRVGVPDPEVHPDGVPVDTPTDEIKYVKHIYCDLCWRKLFLTPRTKGGTVAPA